MVNSGKVTLYSAISGMGGYLADVNWIAVIGGSIAIVSGLINIYATWQRIKSDRAKEARDKAKDDRDKIEHEARMASINHRASHRSGDVPVGAEKFVNEN